MSAPAAETAVGWRELWRQRLSGWIADPKWQRWAARFPLTRPIAERRARALFDLTAGFVYSQTLAACVKLDLFERLRAGPRRIHALAADVGLTPQAGRRLFRAAASLQLLEMLPGERVTLGDLGAAMLGNPSVAAFVRHHALLYDDLRDPVALLRGETKTRLSSFWPYASRGPGASAPAEPSQADRRAYADYCDLMSRSQALIAEDVLEAVAVGRRRLWLDVGGGEGAFVAAAAAQAPHLRFQLFDLPDVAARARESLAARGLTSRVEVVGGDFFSDPLPQGADILSLVRVLHDHDDESARVLLARAHAALAQGGEALIAEPMAEIAGAEPVGDAYFGFYLLAMGRGRARTPAEIAALLTGAGFVKPRLLKTRRPLLASAVAATRA